MLDFKKEILKYKPILNIEEVEDSIHTDEIVDMIDIIADITKNNNKLNKE